MNLIKILFVLFYPLLIIFISFYTFKQTNLIQIINRHWKTILIFSFLLIVFLNAYTIWHMSHENFIYYWDFSGFWRRQLEVMELFREDVNQLIPYVYKTLVSEEYSSFPQLFLIPHMLIVGETYARFVLAMVNFFLVPSQILLYIWCLKITDSIKKDTIWIPIGLGIGIIFFTGNYLPLLLGYVGSAGLVWIVIIGILLNDKKDQRVDILRYIIIGLLMVLLVFIRRWFAYYVLAFFLVTPISYLIHNFINKTLFMKNFIILLINLFISGISALLILIVGFLPLVSTFTQYDYKFAYQSVYSGLGEAIPWFINFYSPFQFVLLLIGTLYGLSIKTLRELVIQAIGIISIVIILFYQVQIFGSHHYFIINIYTHLLILFGIVALVQLNKSKIYKSIVLFTISLFMMSNFLIIFLTQDTNISILLRNKFQFASSQLNAPPRVSQNVDTIRTMVEDLQRIVNEYEYIYVLAGSGTLNDDMLRNSFLPDQLNPLPSIEATKQLDTRDGIPKDFFIYTYIVVANPVQYHNGAPYQHVIGELANGVLYDEELKPYYYPIQEYHLNNGQVNVTIFRRIEDIPENIKEKYRELFRSLYPDYPFLYEFN